ncbi:hypothetical protein HX900_17570 [Rhizobium sp. WYCCWR 11290]|uniref:Uncharacterized protein n=1 Tax=Rhizobium changzhiense TaxID=2692317 RepID=A0A7Z0RJQ9_9HYPH|nr:hypothetical protein [Rhizobium changzhiense]NZD62916.1 hypothetical protein [Rhizobium changzhiense]
MPTISNEAEELHRMCVRFRDHESRLQTNAALAQLFGVKEESAGYHFFVSAIRLRFERFIQVVNEVVPNDRHRSNLNAAAQHLGSFVESRYWQAGWRDTRTNVFTETHLMALDMAGGGLASHAPVALPSEDELRTHVDDLHRALAGVEGSDDFVAQMVSQSIRTVIRMVELFDIFGSAAVGEKLFETHALIKQAADIAPKSRANAYVKAATIVGIVMAGLTSADAGFSAIENFYSRANSIGQLLLANPPALKLLPAPADQGPTVGDGDSSHTADEPGKQESR